MQSAFMYVPRTTLRGFGSSMSLRFSFSSRLVCRCLGFFEIYVLYGIILWANSRHAGAAAAQDPALLEKQLRKAQSPGHLGTGTQGPHLTNLDLAGLCGRSA